MKISIELDGDARIIGAFLGAGISAANDISADPIEKSILIDKIEKVMLRAQAGESGGIFLGKSDPRKTYNGSRRRKL